MLLAFSLFLRSYDLYGSLDSFCHRLFSLIFLTPELVFHYALRSAFSHGDSHRYAQQVGILKLYSGSLISVVEKNFYSCANKVFIYFSATAACS